MYTNKTINKTQSYTNTIIYKTKQATYNNKTDTTNKKQQLYKHKTCTTNKTLTNTHIQDIYKKLHKTNIYKQEKHTKQTNAYTKQDMYHKQKPTHVQTPRHIQKNK